MWHSKLDFSRPRSTVTVICANRKEGQDYGPDTVLLGDV